MRKDGPETRSSPSARGLACILACGLPAPCPQAEAAASKQQPPLSVRVIHHFDFDERREGNLEQLPKYWVPIPHQEYAKFSEGGFDFETGRAAPPSFYVCSAGRDTGFQYQGHAALVQPGVHYRVQGFIRPDRLRFGRACLAAAYLDESGTPLLQTLVRSRWIGGAAADKPTWREADLYLQDAPLDARSIGLFAWVLQEDTWDTSVRTRRPLRRVDVNGGAWFDDITIFALPRVELAIAGPAPPDRRKPRQPLSIVGPGENAYLHVIASDRAGDPLSLSVQIRAADGTRVDSLQRHVDARDAAAQMPLADLPPGLYTAELHVESAGMLVLSRSLTFAKLAPLQSKAPSSAFGLILQPGPIDRALVQNQAVHSLQIPVWPGIGDILSHQDGRTDRDPVLQALAKDGCKLTAVLAATPAQIAEQYGAYTRSVADLLSDDPAGWRQLVADVAAPYSNVFRSWQISAGKADAAETSAELDKALRQLRAVLEEYVLTPRLGVAIDGASPLIGKAFGIEQVTATLAPQLPLPEYGEFIDRFRRHGYEQTAITIEPLAADRFDRLGRLAVWAKRLLAARHGGADVVFAPQTWTVRTADRRIVAEPSEEYLILRTIADLLGDAEPGPSLNLSQGAVCLAFHAGESTVLALWDDTAPAEGRLHSIQLGSAEALVDLWGNTAPLERGVDGRHIVRLTPLPVLIRGVDRWLVDLHAAARLLPEHVEAGVELAEFAVEFISPPTIPLSGECELDVPISWEATPRRFRFATAPGRKTTFPVSLRLAHTESVGAKTLLAKLRLDDGPYLEIPLRLEVRIEDLDVRGVAIIEDRDLVLTQTVHNRSDRIIHLRGSAAVPGRERQYRPFTDLGPGEVQSTEYRFRDSADLVGRRVVLTLRELNDGPSNHAIELQVP